MHNAAVNRPLLVLLLYCFVFPVKNNSRSLLSPAMLPLDLLCLLPTAAFLLTNVVCVRWEHGCEGTICVDLTMLPAWSESGAVYSFVSGIVFDWLATHLNILTYPLLPSSDMQSHCHWNLSRALACASFQERSISSSSIITVLRKVIFGLPIFLFPIRVHLKASLGNLSLDISDTYLSHRSLHFQISREGPHLRSFLSKRCRRFYPSSCCARRQPFSHPFLFISSTQPCGRATLTLLLYIWSWFWFYTVWTSRFCKVGLNILLNKVAGELGNSRSECFRFCVLSWKLYIHRKESEHRFTLRLKVTSNRQQTKYLWNNGGLWGFFSCLWRCQKCSEASGAGVRTAFGLARISLSDTSVTALYF